MDGKKMPIDIRSLTPPIAYRLMTGIVVPRPIAWVTSLSAEGVLNLAPFSAFTFVSMNPVLIGINIGRKAGVRKDTEVNIRASGEYVVHIGGFADRHAIHESSAEHPPEVSEAEVLGLATTASDRVEVPRLRDAPVAMECKLDQIVSFGRGGSEFVVGEVLLVHAREGLVKDGKIDTRALDPICRIAGPNYASLGEIVTMRNIELAEK
jgi:flavin reductase (DIM6/NTAB) family NADH-FMN oxidoreductase RutF